MTTNPVIMDGVSAVKTKEEKGDDKPRKCYNCGGEGYLAINRSPAKGKKCAKCGRYGHFALCCQGKSDNYANRGKPDQRRRGSDRRQSYNANFVGYQDASDSEETVLLHLQLQRIKEKHAMQLVLKNQCWK